jgi:hypothetical protein
LFKDAGVEEYPELLSLVATAQQQALELERMHAVESENDRLKQEVKKLRDLYYAKTLGTMSTKLKDALRE